MSLISRSLIVSSFVLSACAMVASAQAELPDGPGKAVVEKVCGDCHLTYVITQNRATKDHWQEIVDAMISRGAEASDQEVDQIVQYLVAHFGPDSPPVHAKKSASAKINVNQASAEDLARGLAISDKSAGSIVEYRTAHGKFKNLEDLEKVPGVDAKQLESKTDLIEF